MTHAHATLGFVIWASGAALAAALGSAGCDSPLDQRLAIIDAPRVLAVIADPAEARPGAQVSYGGRRLARRPGRRGTAVGVLRRTQAADRR